MFSKEIMEILKQVITSWQVIAVTIGLVLYLNIVFYVSKAYHVPKFTKKIRFRRKPKAEAAIPGGPETTSSSSGDDNAELGLEES